MIDLIPNDEQQAVVDAAAAFLAREAPRPRLRALAAAGDTFDRALLEHCGKLGWFGLGLGADAGGAGLTLVEETLLFRELGCHLAPGPFLATVLAAKVAHAAGDASLLERLVAGTAIAGLAEIATGDDILTVWDSGPVDVVLVAVAEGRRLRLHDAADLPVGDSVASIDPLYRIGRCAVPTTVLADAGPASGRLVLEALVLAAAQLVGLAEQTRDDAADYAKTRVQFGKPIGAFQAVKHRCADMAVRAEAAWAQTAIAALRVVQAGEAAEFDAVAAKAVAGDAAIRNARDNIQNHGGIGYTAEHDAHLFLKRAHVVDQQLGSLRHHAATLLDVEPGW
jgi:alkylation response protein AidB-like acyl-CoA dehydrogenase